jgi:hypothetical protein
VPPWQDRVQPITPDLLPTDIGDSVVLPDHFVLDKTRRRLPETVEDEDTDTDSDLPEFEAIEGAISDEEVTEPAAKLPVKVADWDLWADSEPSEEEFLAHRVGKLQEDDVRGLVVVFKYGRSPSANDFHYGYIHAVYNNGKCKLWSGHHKRTAVVIIDRVCPVVEHGSLVRIDVTKAQQKDMPPPSPKKKPESEPDSFQGALDDMKRRQQEAMAPDEESKQSEVPAKPTTNPAIDQVRKRIRRYARDLEAERSYTHITSWESQWDVFRLSVDELNPDNRKVYLGRRNGMKDYFMSLGPSVSRSRSQSVAAPRRPDPEYKPNIIDDPDSDSDDAPEVIKIEIEDDDSDDAPFVAVPPEEYPTQATYDRYFVGELGYKNLSGWRCPHCPKPKDSDPMKKDFVGIVNGQKCMIHRTSFGKHLKSGLHRRNEKHADELERVNAKKRELERRERNESIDPARGFSAETGFTRMPEDLPDLPMGPDSPVGSLERSLSRSTSPETHYPMSPGPSRFTERMDNLDREYDSEEAEIDLASGQQGPRQHFDEAPPPPRYEEPADPPADPAPPQPTERGRIVLEETAIEEKGGDVLMFIAVGFAFLAMAYYID